MAHQRMDEGSIRSEIGRTTYPLDDRLFPLNASNRNHWIAEQILAPPTVHRLQGNADRDGEFEDGGYGSAKSSLSSKDYLDSSSTIATPPSSRPNAAESSLLRKVSHSQRLEDFRSGPFPTDPNPEVDLEKAQSCRPSSLLQEAKDPNLIEWDGPCDPGNPQNWPRWRKWVVTMILGLITVCITFASSIFSTATMATAAQFDVSSEVMILGTSLFVLGFAVGPPIWGPLSELFGRKYPMFIGFFIFAIFQLPVAVAQNVQTIMLCRFLGGIFGSAPLGIVGGQLTDIWDVIDRGVAMTIFAGATFIGPVAGPIIGGFIGQSHLGWRWTEYLTIIMGFSFGAIGFILVPETYGPVLLTQRAKKISDEQQVDLKNIVEKCLLRPFAMLFREPILILVTIYMSLIYGILYLFFEAYPIAFQETRGWNPGVGALPFLSITGGVMLGGSIIVFTTKTRFRRKLEKHGHVVPEERLIPMVIGGALFPIGMFWFAWTTNPNILWVPQVLAGIPIGAGVLMIFLQGRNYIIDCYLMYANSAIAANTFVRSFVGAGFPMFATAMYHTLGVDWATSLLGFLTAALFLVPVLFFFYGKKIRDLSKYTPT